MVRPPRIMISAGEASGDRLGAGLAAALRARRPDVVLLGMGGEFMQREGVRRLFDSAEVAVVGIGEVLAHLPAIRRAMATLERALRQERPDLLVPIDFPDFNLRLAARAGKAGVPVVYFVSPQIWAWRRGRVRRIRRLVRRMLVLFPFEVRFYEEAGVPVEFVGHPVAQQAASQADPARLLARVGLEPGRKILALLPGSRRMEVARLLPVMLGAAVRLKRERPELQFLIPAAPELGRERLVAEVEASGLTDFSVHEGDFPELLSICEAGVVASGTASLQAAVVGMPMVVVYRVGRITSLLGRLLIKIDTIALPNLVAGRQVVPELLQADCNPASVAAALAGYLDDPTRTDEVRAALGEVKARLGGAGVFDRAADAVLAELDRLHSG